MNIAKMGISLINHHIPLHSGRKERHIRLRADSSLISLSIITLIAAMVLEGLLFLPFATSSLKVQIQTFTLYVFATSMVMLVVVVASLAFKRKF
jgi:hypothetical protein